MAISFPGLKTHREKPERKGDSSVEMSISGAHKHTRVQKNTHSLVIHDNKITNSTHWHDFWAVTLTFTLLPIYMLNFYPFYRFSFTLYTIHNHKIFSFSRFLSPPPPLLLTVFIELWFVLFEFHDSQMAMAMVNIQIKSSLYKLKT